MLDDIFEKAPAEELEQHRREEVAKMESAIQEQLNNPDWEAPVEEVIEEPIEDKLDEKLEELEPEIEQIPKRTELYSPLELVRIAKITEGLSDEEFDRIYDKSDGSVASIKRLASDPKTSSEVRRKEIIKGLKQGKTYKRI